VFVGVACSFWYIKLGLAYGGSAKLAWGGEGQRYLGWGEGTGLGDEEGGLEF